MSESYWMQYLKMHHSEKRFGETGQAETFCGCYIPQVNTLTIVIPSWVLTLKKPASRVSLAGKKKKKEYFNTFECIISVCIQKGQTFLD